MLPDSEPRSTLAAIFSAARDVAEPNSAFRAAGGPVMDASAVMPIATRVDASADQIAAARAEGDAAGRLAERARIAAILSAPAAGIVPYMAAQVALRTNLPVAAAIETLEIGARDAQKAVRSAARSTGRPPVSATAIFDRRRATAVGEDLTRAEGEDVFAHRRRVGAFHGRRA